MYKTRALTVAAREHKVYSLRPLFLDGDLAVDPLVRPAKQ